MDLVKNVGGLTACFKRCSQTARGPCCLEQELPILLQTSWSAALQPFSARFVSLHRGRHALEQGTKAALQPLAATGTHLKLSVNSSSLQVACQGYTVDLATVTSLLEVLQGYAALRGLAFLGCNFGDEALQAVSKLVQHGCGKWWTGPRLQLLEISSQQPATAAEGNMRLNAV